MSNEMLVMNLIVDAGNARSLAMGAIQLAKAGKLDEADSLIEDAKAELVKVHNSQTELIQEEVRGNHTEINLFMIHAQDHIMTSMLARDLAAEMVDLYRQLEENDVLKGEKDDTNL